MGGCVLCTRGKFHFVKEKKSLAHLLISQTPLWWGVCACLCVCARVHVWIPSSVQKARAPFWETSLPPRCTEFRLYVGVFYYLVWYRLHHHPLHQVCLFVGCFLPIFIYLRGFSDNIKEAYSKQSSLDNLYDATPEKHPGWFGTFYTRNLHFSPGWKCH
jgi:hypothetical protein